MLGMQESQILEIKSRKNFSILIRLSIFESWTLRIFWQLFLLCDWGVTSKGTGMLRWKMSDPLKHISHHEFALLCYQSRKWENMRAEVCFKVWSHKLYEIAWSTISYETKGELIYIIQVSLTIKLADCVKKGCTNVNETNVSKSIWYHSYDI